MGYLSRSSQRDKKGGDNKVIWSGVRVEWTRVSVSSVLHYIGQRWCQPKSWTVEKLPSPLSMSRDKKYKKTGISSILLFIFWMKELKHALADFFGNFDFARDLWVVFTEQPHKVRWVRLLPSTKLHPVELETYSRGAT